MSQREEITNYIQKKHPELMDKIDFIVRTYIQLDEDIKKNKLNNVRPVINKKQVKIKLKE
tara:strand:- start:765 stop:944 length:180 start_codon:yes stop_codon:yes gene_type:complete